MSRLDSKGKNPVADKGYIVFRSSLRGETFMAACLAPRQNKNNKNIKIIIKKKRGGGGGGGKKKKDHTSTVIFPVQPVDAGSRGKFTFSRAVCGCMGAVVFGLG